MGDAAGAREVRPHTRFVSLTHAAQIAGVKPGTIIAWVARGHIHRYPGGYSTRELIDRVDSRDVGKAIGGLKASACRVERASETL